MTEQELINKLKEQQNNTDRELAHGTADSLLCEFLVELGYIEVVEEYDKIDKWYA